MVLDWARRFCRDGPVQGLNMYIHGGGSPQKINTRQTCKLQVFLNTYFRLFICQTHTPTYIYIHTCIYTYIYIWLCLFTHKGLVYPGCLIHKAQIFHLVRVQAGLRGPWWRWAPFWLELGLGLGFVLGPGRDVDSEIKTSVCVPREANCHIEKQHGENKIWHGAWLRWKLWGQLEPLGPPVVGIQVSRLVTIP